MIMLPPLTSFPLDEFVLSIAVEAYFTARKQLEMVDKSKLWTERNFTYESALTRMVFINMSTEVSANAMEEAMPA